jgi:hypothetical protein
MTENTTATATLASLKDVRDHFGLDGKEMVAQWRKLSDADKRDLRAGVGDGTLNY